MAVFVLLLATFNAWAAPNALTSFQSQHPGAKALFTENQDAPRLLYDFAAATVKTGSDELKARDFLRRNTKLIGLSDVSELRFDRRYNLGKVRALRFTQEWQGIPVYLGQVNVVLNDKDEVVRVHNQALSIRNLNPVPTISPYEAIAEAWASVYGFPTDSLRTTEMDTKQTKLYIWQTAGKMRLAYAVAMPLPFPTERRIAFVDAHSGEFLMSLNQVVFMKQADVFEYNPGADEQGTLVTRDMPFLSLPATAGDPIQTEGEKHYALNCPDEGGTMTVPFLGSVPVCTERHVAEADANGDFLLTPAFGNWEDAGVSGDEFSELHLFYQVGIIYQYFLDLAMEIDSTTPPFTSLEQQKLRCIANFKMLDYEALLGGGIPTDLIPFDNAFYSPTGGIVPQLYPQEDSIVFGQGTDIDFSYDGEVVFHEFTHAVIDSTIKLTSIIADQYGLATDPGAMNEGFADFFSAAYVGDPSLAEYVGNAFGDNVALRDLENDKVCPDDVKGEVHDDSEWWSGALWEIREWLITDGADADEVAAVIFEGLLELSQSPTFTQGAVTIASHVEDWYGTDAKAAAENIFQARGIWPAHCNRAVPTEENEFFEMITLYDNGSSGLSPFTPGFFQFKLTVPADVDYIRADFNSIAQGGLVGGSMDIKYLVKKDGPVLFAYTDDTVSATYDLEAEAAEWESTNPQLDKYVALIMPEGGGSFVAGDYYIAIANTSSGGGSFMGGGSYMMGHVFTFGEGEAPCHTDADCPACNICNDTHACEVIVPECDTDADCEDDEFCDIGDCGGFCEALPVDGDDPDGDDPDGDDPDGDNPDGDEPGMHHQRRLRAL